MSQFDRISDEIRSIRAALSLYVGGALPPDLEGTADANGLPTAGWVFPLSAPVAGRFEDLSPQLTGAGQILRRRAEQAGVRMLVPGDPGWPAGTGADELPCLWVAGDCDVAGALRQAVTAAGAIDASAYGTHVAADLGVVLGEAEWTVVAAAHALGVCAAAVRGARAADGRVLLVADRGHDQFTVPPMIGGDTSAAEHASLISPFPPGSRPGRSRYAVHQHLLGTFGAASVIVEEKHDGWSLTVARAAAASGRLVCAVPGPVTSALSQGCHSLIAEGSAQLVTGATGVLDAIGRQFTPAPAGVPNLYRIVGTASWDDGRWRTRRLPDFHVEADTARSAADHAYQVVFAANPQARGNTLTCGVFGPNGVYEAVEVSCTD
ncbi:DNA-processing protein DprA [Actinoplanes regularis]|uniref:DNA recombination-mediator protein A n=1 Tax=Actinoplanes regularis TaxID=52697 RepID=A0A238XJN0_9ACTN|nr:DNA-processing protein DprA [Actinoplanes regularis]GIE90511.1 hypothetical protein Are01nite_69910 [Actinoplanes regularis]SNR58920.1 DNA recombination-mediator protein A [Actinoplanes regularis]